MLFYVLLDTNYFEESGTYFNIFIVFLCEPYNSHFNKIHQIIHDTKFDFKSLPIIVIT